MRIAAVSASVVAVARRHEVSGQPIHGGRTIVAPVTEATAAGNFPVTRYDYLCMLCHDVRASVSAGLDGELPALPPDVVDHHLRGLRRAAAAGPRR